MNRIGIFLAFLLFAVPCWAAPDDCLRQINTAIENGDAAAFEQLVDIDAILAASLDMFLKEARKPANTSKLAPMLAIMLSSQGGETVRNLLTQEARAFVLNGISSGAFAGKKLGNGQGHGILAPLFANASLGKKEIRGMGEPVKDDTGWYMPFSVHDYGNDNDYAIVGRFEPGEGSTRLVSIENLDQIFNQIQREATSE